METEECGCVRDKQMEGTRAGERERQREKKRGMEGGEGGWRLLITVILLDVRDFNYRMKLEIKLTPIISFFFLLPKKKLIVIASHQ